MDLEMKVLGLELAIECTVEDFEELCENNEMNPGLFLEYMKHLEFLRLEYEIYSGLLEQDKKAQRKAKKNRKL